MLTKYFIFFSALSSLSAYASDPGAAFTDRLQNSLRLSMPRFACNLSPAKPKPVVRTVNGVPVTIELVPQRGSVIAATSMSNPDYYFHWVRDSGLVAETLARLLPILGESSNADKVRNFLGDFVHFSKELQESDSAFGLGDPRFNVDGSVDTSFWGRPQHDGPALRSLAIMRFLKNDKAHISPSLLKEVKETLGYDLNHTSYAFRAKSFDIWEFSFGHHFFTGMAQLSAFEMAKATVPEFARKEWPIGIKDITTRLGKQWDDKNGFYKNSLGSVNDFEGLEIADAQDRLDASLVLAVNGSSRREGLLSLRDPKVMASLDKLEEYFRHHYPINEEHSFGPAIGRHQGDDYFGGNPWYMLTAGFGEYYYRLAADIKTHDEPFIVNKLNRSLLENVMGRELQVGQNLAGNDTQKAELLSRLLEKGDAFLTTVMDYTGRDGMMAEQFDQRSGAPVSAENLTWSYSAFLSAVIMREGVVDSQIDFTKLPLDCANP